MKLRSTHIVVGVLVGIAGFMAYALLRPEPAELQAARDAAANRIAQESAFLEQVRAKQEKVDLLDGGVGSVIPPETGSSELSPNISVETTDVDLGVVPNDARSSHPFVIRNTGGMELKIHAVQASCSCTQGVIPPTGLTIAPGGEATMPILIEPSQIPGWEATRLLTIASNDPDTPSLKLNVTSKVNPEVIVEPKEFNFGELRKGEEATMTAIIRQVQAEPFSIETVDASGGKELPQFHQETMFSFAERPKELWQHPDKIEYEVTARLNGEIPSGDYRSLMYIKSNLQRLPWFYLTLTAHVVPPYTLSPKSPEPLPLPNDGVRTAPLTVTSESPVSIENLRFDPTLILAEVEPSENPLAAKLLVKVAPTAPGGPLTTLLQYDVVYEGKVYPERIYARSTVPPRAGADAAAPPPASQPESATSAVSPDALQ